MRRQLGERGRLRLRRRHLDWHLGAIEQANGRSNGHGTYLNGTRRCSEHMHTREGGADGRSNGHGAHAIEQGDFDDDPQR